MDLDGAQALVAGLDLHGVGAGAAGVVLIHPFPGDAGIGDGGGIGALCIGGGVDGHGLLDGGHGHTGGGAHVHGDLLQALGTIERTGGSDHDLGDAQGLALVGDGHGVVAADLAVIVGIEEC